MISVTNDSIRVWGGPPGPQPTPRSASTGRGRPARTRGSALLRFGLGSQDARSVGRRRLDELPAAVTFCRPVLIDRYHPHWFETRPDQRSPARIAVEFACVFLRASFGVGEPYHRIALGLLGDRLRERVDFLLLGDKRKAELDLAGILEI